MQKLAGEQLLSDSPLKAESTLSFLWLEITSKCNLECLHCYADASPGGNLLGSMQLRDWLTILRDATELGCEEVQFIGGEPTLHPDLGKMIEAASEYGYNVIEVFTNATVISERLLSNFVKNGVQIATSFYSDDPEIHDRITNRPGSFARSVSVLKKLIGAGLDIRAGVIETKQNHGHAERASTFLRNLGVGNVKVDSQRAVGRGAQIVSSLEPMSQLCGECWKGKLCVTCSGRVYPCVFARFTDLGEISSGIRSILAHNALTNFRTSLREYQKSKERGQYPPELRATPTSAQEINACNPQQCIPPTFCAPLEAPGPCNPDRSCNPNR